MAEQLVKYKEKRDFNRTTESAGGKPGSDKLLFGGSGWQTMTCRKRADQQQLK